MNQPCAAEGGQGGPRRGSEKKERPRRRKRRWGCERIFVPCRDHSWAGNSKHLCVFFRFFSLRIAKGPHRSNGKGLPDAARHRHQGLSSNLKLKCIFFSLPISTVNCKRAVVFVHVQTLKKENVDRVFYFQALVVLNRILSNFHSFTCLAIAMDYRTLSFNASVKAVLENKKLDPHFLSSKFEHVQKRQLFCN